MGKMVVLKPVVWNGSGYLGPTGDNTSSGYAGEHGYGHEEWNGRSDWVWKGWKVFHTQGKGQMFEYSARGDLGILMTTIREGRFYAVGVACAVYENDDADRAAIAKDLRLKANGGRVWKLDKVRGLKVDRAEFDAHWEDAHAWVQWRCPQSHYAWFDAPVEIVPDDVIPAIPPRPRRRAIIKMHSSYQAIRPDQALAIIGKAVPSSHPVLAWLSTGDFDAVSTRSVRDAPPPRVRSGRSAGTAVDPYTRYLQENEFQVTPKHHLLQSAFERFLAKSKAKRILSNVGRVDVRYHDASRGQVLAEIKPSDQQTVRFAIRAALGQLLDYRQGHAGDAELLVVIGCEPTSSADIALAIDNGFGVAWPKGEGFAVRWPA